MMQAASPLASRRRNRSTLNPWAKAVSVLDRKSTRLNSSHSQISYAVFCLKKKKKKHQMIARARKLPIARTWRLIVVTSYCSHVLSVSPPRELGGPRPTSRRGTDVVKCVH